MSTDRNPGGVTVHVCPICRDPFHGSIAAFEKHVNDHLDNDNDLDPTPSPAILAEESSLVEAAIGELSTHLEQSFPVQCEADGCTMMVLIEDMAEHMDRHLAEQIQQREGSNSPLSSKRDRDTAESSTAKRARGHIPAPAQGTKRSGQTTMDGFMGRAGNAVAGAIAHAKLTFLSESRSLPTGATELISKARLLLEMSVEHGVTKVAYLADPSIVFYQSDRSDRGWGCGYRNIQMLLSYVICQPSSSGSEATSTHASSERRKVTPTIQDLQRQLEFAWSIGFDPTGAAQLGHKVVNTQKWIGTTEAWSVLSSLGVRCNMLDFHRPTGPGGTHPALLDAVRDYFRASEWSALAPPNPYGLGGIDRQQRGVIQTRRPPIYMQHQGHSRTIVGYELLENGEANLLVFDPGRWLHKSISKINRAALSRSVTDCKGTSTTTRDGLLDAQYFLKAFRLQLTPSNTKSQYQLLGISGLYNDSGDSARSSTRPNELDLFSENSALSVGWNHEEHQESKLVVSSRVP